MSSQEEMLKKVRRALGRGVNPPAPAIALPPSDIRTPLPSSPEDELLPRFEAELQAVGGKTYRAASRSELDKILLSLLEACHGSRVVLSRNPILLDIKMKEKCWDWGKTAVVWSGKAGPEEDSFRRECFAADAGITGVSFVLAESGSLVLTSQAEGAQLASLAPPVHIALYRRNQLCATLEDLLERLPVSTDPRRQSPARSVVFITGTSRTADIEQILIRGVHGPREVHAILVEDACLSEAGVPQP